MVLSVGSFAATSAVLLPEPRNRDGRARGRPKDAPAELASWRNPAAPGKIGPAYTYNEPLVGLELSDCAREIRARGMQNKLVTPRLLRLAPLEELSR
jgi:hypothetical protein